MKLYDENKYEEQDTTDPRWRTSFSIDTPRVKLRYRDIILICEVYVEPGGLMVNMLCPKCRHSLKITTARKAIEWDRDTGRISIERSECPWEIDTDVGVGVFTHTNLCKFNFVVDNNVVRDV